MAFNRSKAAGEYTHPNHTGDVTSVGDGATTIANDAVTYAKMQDVSATDKLLGRSSANAGDVEEVICTSAGRAILDDANAAAQRTTLGLAIGTDVEAFDAATAKTDEANDFTAAQSGAIDTTQASTGVCDLSEGNNHEITIAGSTTISVSNPVAGMSGVIKIIHDGSNVPSFSGFKFPDGTVPTITNTASNVDILAYYCESTSRVSAVYHSNMS